MVRSGVPYRLIKDHIGSVRFVVNANTGAVMQELEYDPFGRVLADSSPGFQPFGFAGGLYDWDTELVRFGARDYDPSVGRWTAKDPILFGGGDTNLYVYVYNNPTNLVDPVGLWGVAIGLGGGAGLTYLGGGYNASAGVFIGSDGFGVYGSASYTAGLGGFVGAGLEGTVYADRALAGPGVGANFQLPVAGGSANFNQDGLTSVTGSLGAEVGLWAGAHAGGTAVFNFTDWLYNLLGGPSSCESGWGARQPGHGCERKRAARPNECE